MHRGAVLLAAGEGARMGGRVKPLLELDGVALVRRNALALCGAGIGDIVAVVGHRADQVASALRELPVRIIRNAQYAQGQASSVRAGLAALPSRVDVVVIALADMPLITTPDIASLLQAFEGRSHGHALVPFVDGERGNPVVVDSTVREGVLSSSVWSFGCRQWIDRHSDQVFRFATDNPHYKVDLDTLSDLETFERLYGQALCWPTSEDLPPTSPASR